jgi:hypothetical protein
MNSFVLLLWLVAASGNQQTLATRYFNDEAACQQAGQRQVEAYANKGKRVIFKCHQALPEYSGEDIDVNGNPI